MFELQGKYNSCKVFTDNVDNETIGQLNTLLNQKCTEGNQIRIMSDTHAGKGCVIGTTIKINNNKVIPNLVGVDIGCGMLSIKLKQKRLNLPELDSIIRKYVPSGFDIHDTAIATSNIDQIKCPINKERAYKSLGTLGGGNHFIEVDRDSNDDLYLVIHTGSRHLGIEICDYYQNLAFERISEKLRGGKLSDLNKKLVAEYTAAGRTKEISKALTELKKKYKEQGIDVPQALAYLEDSDFEDYIHDMKLAQEHASINRATIADQIIKHARLYEVERFETIHNYIDCDNMILRKGSVSAQAGEKLIIPMNMRDGSLICIGKGNPDWNYSAPHGAGRLMSRSKAKESISMSEYKSSMEGIYTTCVNTATIDESPMAYKPMDEIKQNIQDTVEIIDTIKPIYNFKAGEE
jgi:RNA-splicing ligase RtcB